MSSIGTSIELYDRVSATLNRIQANLEATTSAFQAVDVVSNRCFSQNQIDAVSSELVRYEQHIESVENQLKEANLQIDRMKDGTRQAKEEARSLGGAFDSVFNLFGAYMGLQGFQQLILLSDSMGQAEAKLAFITEDMSEQAEMQERIFQSAQRSRGSYMAMADNVAKLGQRAGDAFNSNDEILQFSENLTKMFVIAGASTAEMNSASLQLTQALGSGVLRGEELNAVFESAPNVIQAIAKYLNVPVGQIRDMASEGQITSEIVKNAMLSATDEINAQFENMPMTWGQIWTMTMNQLLKLSQPILNFISMLAQHWETLKPIAIGLAVAIGLYVTALAIGKVVMLAHTAIITFQTMATTAWTMATFAQTIAQHGLNTALMECPITWIIFGIIALVTAIYMIAQAVADTSDSVKSGFGVISGVIVVAGAFIYNTVVGVLNALMGLFWTIFVYPFLNGIEFVLNIANGGFNSFGDGVANLIGKIAGWFLSLGSVVTKIIDAIFGTDWTFGLNQLKEDVQAWGKNEQAVTLDRSFTGIQRMEYGDAYAMGAEWGDGVSTKISGALGNTDTLNNIATNTATTANGVNALKEGVDISNEQLQYMRDVAEQEVINRYTTAEIKVEMTNNNNISKDIDIDDFIRTVSDGVNEAMKVSAEGVH